MTTNNFSFGINPIPEVENGYTFTRANFTQVEPHTEILAGITGLTFVQCNLANCDVPGDAILDDCLQCHISWCANNHPELVDRGLIDAEVANCPHVVDTDEVWIDGELVDTTYTYEDEEVA
ncbi:unnamed protein product [marine sediment metagenome]|uniref:Uncharacterized protein n=1 Tax=marine sediment metagenome TaxID=412755 RepID=X1ASF1_9ZZZZ